MLYLNEVYPSSEFSTQERQERLITAALHDVKRLNQYNFNMVITPRVPRFSDGYGYDHADEGKQLILDKLPTLQSTHLDWKSIARAVEQHNKLHPAYEEEEEDDPRCLVNFIRQIDTTAILTFFDSYIRPIVTEQVERYEFLPHFSTDAIENFYTSTTLVDRAVIKTQMDYVIYMLGWIQNLKDTQLREFVLGNGVMATLKQFLTDSYHASLVNGNGSTASMEEVLDQWDQLVGKLY
ncbi:hypothetical protein KC717_06810 [Candidatus Dojkabacteria bacterium]|uniref:Uncharacterized protein n=1 Tax=Candidatus Dojkabacteria bacterium TaxID=2099670 RepID=A0A955LA60_9BACT|nr:hypothetical protein [Candidatus Dojkabacteria bacterium]